MLAKQNFRQATCLQRAVNGRVVDRLRREIRADVARTAELLRTMEGLGAREQSVRMLEYYALDILTASERSVYSCCELDLKGECDTTELEELISHPRSSKTHL